MKHNKIIFLDVDGVINTERTRCVKFDVECMNFLSDIIKKTNAKIVVSSSWRDSDADRMKQNFLEHGFTEELWEEIIDITIRGYQHVIKGSKLPLVRGNEIKAYVDTQLKYPWIANPEMKELYEIKNPDGSFKIMKSNVNKKDYSYVILDDDTDFLLEQKDSFINTHASIGLNKEDADKAIKILNCIDCVN